MNKLDSIKIRENELG